jgi:aconitate hydratase
VLHHNDRTKDEIKVNHTYNQQQIEWFKAGSALNLIRKQMQSN